MKCTLTVVCFLIYAFAFGQKPAEKKLWIGDDNTYLMFYKDEVSVEHFSEYLGKRHAGRQSYKYFMLGDTLRIIETNFNDTLKHDFSIKNISEDELKLRSISPNPRILFFTKNPRNILSFRTQQKVYTDTINFQKIVFSSTTCYGSCPAMKFEIDNNKSMNFKGEKYAVKQGYYKATLLDQLYNDLLKTLAVSELDKLDKLETISFMTDVPTYTLEVQYNNKVRKMQSASVPFVIYDFIKLLLEIPKHVDLNEADPMTISFTW